MESTVHRVYCGPSPIARNTDDTEPPARSRRTGAAGTDRRHGAADAEPPAQSRHTRWSRQPPIGDLAVSDCLSLKFDEDGLFYDAAITAVSPSRGISVLWAATGDFNPWPQTGIPLAYFTPDNARLSCAS